MTLQHATECIMELVRADVLLLIPHQAETFREDRLKRFHKPHLNGGSRKEFGYPIGKQEGNTVYRMRGGDVWSIPPVRDAG